jgi:hypothetical protein
VAALNQVIALAVGFIVLLHPGFVVPSWVQGAVPIVAQAAATAVWIWALVTHKALTLSALSHNTQMEWQRNENQARLDEAALSHQFQTTTLEATTPPSLAGTHLNVQPGAVISIQLPSA